jgi:prevent-host-death family protein
VKVVKIAQAKNNLSRYLAMVRSGERIRIVDRNQPVADLVPIEPGDHEDEELIEALVRSGLARPGATGPMPPQLLEASPVAAGSGVLDALLEERRSTR